MATQAAKADYDAALLDLIGSADSADAVAARLPALAQEAGLPDKKVREIHVSTLRNFLLRALDDDCLTEDEEAQLNKISEVLGIDQQAFQSQFADMMPRLVVARVNDGRIPTLPDPHIILKKGEVAHVETNAALLKEVAVREWRGGYSGVSFRIAKGVRYHTGGSRGKSVVVGTEIQTEDSGLLTVTSNRAVFSGARRTIEMPYTKLVTLNIYSDGLQVHLSNRKNPPMFRLDKGLGDVVAAVINGAAQQSVA